MKFYESTDNRDIDNHAYGVTPAIGYDNRGLHVQIRHNRDKVLAATANKMAAIIAAALNNAIEAGELVLPDVATDR